MRVILLEHPRPTDPERFQDVVNAPLSACLTTGYIASVLQANKIQVEIVDANLYGWSLEKTISELSKKSFDLLGIHTVYLWDNTKSVFDMLLRLREQRVGAGLPSPYINLYGFYPTFACERILLEYPFIDSVTLGESEFTFLELAKKIKAGLKNPHHNTGGIAYSINNTVIKNKPRQLIENLDVLPFPLRDVPKAQELETDKARTNKFVHAAQPLTPNVRPEGRGESEGGEKSIHTYILGSRGCYGNCTFCYINPFYGDESLWRGRSPENIVEEIYQLQEHHKVEYFYFADANFFGLGECGKERAKRLSELIIKNGLKIGFGIECRANDVDEKTFSSLVHAGLKQVFLGIESGSQTSLNRFKKGVSVEVNKRAIQMLRQFGIEPFVGFIMFEPYSTIADIRANFEFLKGMRLLTAPSATAHLLHHKETLFKGTPDYSTPLPYPPPRGGRGGVGAKYESFTGYEAAYTFKDERVTMLSDTVTRICKKALDRIRNAGCGMRNNSAFRTPHSALENQELVDSFEQHLRDLEACSEPN